MHCVRPHQGCSNRSGRIIGHYPGAAAELQRERYTTPLTPGKWGVIVFRGTSPTEAIRKWSDALPPPPTRGTPCSRGRTYTHAHIIPPAPRYTNNNSFVTAVGSPSAATTTTQLYITRVWTIQVRKPQTNCKSTIISYYYYCMWYDPISHYVILLYSVYYGYCSRDRFRRIRSRSRTDAVVAELSVRRIHTILLWYSVRHI